MEMSDLSAGHLQADRHGHTPKGCPSCPAVQSADYSLLVILSTKRFILLGSSKTFNTPLFLRRESDSMLQGILKIITGVKLCAYLMLHLCSRHTLVNPLIMLSMGSRP